MPVEGVFLTGTGIIGIQPLKQVFPLCRGEASALFRLLWRTPQDYSDVRRIRPLFSQSSALYFIFLFLGELVQNVWSVENDGDRRNLRVDALTNGEVRWLPLRLAGKLA